MGYYDTWIAKQERLKKEAEEQEEQLKKEGYIRNYQKYKYKNYEKQKERARKYYWENREYVLARQQVKKYQKQEYYKEWYQKNKEQLNQIRYGENAGKRTKQTKEKPIIKKPVSFICFA